MTTSKETQKPETYVLRMDLEQFAFDLSREQFEEAMDLQFDLMQRDMKEKLMEDYDKKKAVKMEP